MNAKQQELYAAGKRAAYKNQCDSVIVAPDHTGEDNYHVCGDKPAHMGSHSSGSGYEWNWNGEITKGADAMSDTGDMDSVGSVRAGTTKEEGEMSAARVLIVQPTGLSVVKEIDTELDSLKAVVGGWIEAVTLESCHLYCNEEGKLMGLQPNIFATELAHRLGWPLGDMLCGPVVFLGNTDDGGEGDVPQAVLDAASDFYQPDTP